MKIFAVIVVFNPNEVVLRKLVGILSDQVDTLVIVDNSVDSQPMNYLSDDLIYLLNHNKSGIAGAHNLGLSTAFESGATHVVLFDQDSLPSNSFISRLLETLVRAESGLSASIVIGPSIFCTYEDRLVIPRLSKSGSDDQGYRVVNQLIASGMVISHDVYQSVGGMQEALFIDAVDHEWCWRAISRGVVVCQATEVVLEHKLGDGRYKVFGVWTKLTAPRRLYYQFRNTIWLLPISYVPLYWKIRNIAAIPIKLLLCLFLHPEKRGRFQFAFKGLKDGICGVRQFIKANRSKR